MRLAGSTKIHELLETYPFLEDFLASHHAKFEMLRNRMARATIGRAATLRAAAGIAGIDLNAFIEAIAVEIEKHSGRKPDLDVLQTAPAHTREERLATLKAIVQDLHDGGDLEQARQHFAGAVGDVEASEIAAMEEELIRGGIPVSEVQRLCDVHVGAFRSALDEHAEVETPPGHPVHTFKRANRVVTRLANELGRLARKVEAGGDLDDSLKQASRVLDELGGLENHYQRKENQLFPLLERHGVRGPSQVMWGIHDEIRAALKTVRGTIEKKDSKAFASAAPALARDIIEMVYKEEKILFPLSLQALSDEEWAEIRRGDDALGYVLAQPAVAWPGGHDAGSKADATPPGLLALTTGELSLDQLNLILTHLPVDLAFVDENDTVRFYSEGPERIFPRSPAVIGRKVQNCHPPKSVHMVQDILDSFRSGKQSVAEFWIQLHGKFIHIRYFAIRDGVGTYRGCLEVTQDVTSIRELEGEQRLLQWRGSDAG
jgi:DUF438 domain-containing protein